VKSWEAGRRLLNVPSRPGLSNDNGCSYEREAIPKKIATRQTIDVRSVPKVDSTR